VRDHAVSVFWRLIFSSGAVFSQSNQSNPGALSFWLANASELLHFVKQDRDVSSGSIAAQNHLAEIIHLAFSLLTTCLQSELAHTMTAFLSPDSGRCCIGFIDKCD